MTKRSKWFEADPRGLALLLERRGIEHAVYELYANAADTQATEIAIELSPVSGRPLCELRVRDNDPIGFANLAHAYTLFAESDKKQCATSMGRFNLGEKLVLARCVEAQIRSTQGAVNFSEDGERWESTREKLPRGSEFWGLLRMTRDEYATCKAMRLLLVQGEGRVVTFNGETLQPRVPIDEVEATLLTELSEPGPDQPLRRSRRKTTVRIFEPLAGEPARLYELDVPVVATGDTWDVQIRQRVPLNMERDNVTPAYLRDVRAVVLNAMRGRLTPDIAAEPWAEEAGGSALAEPEAIAALMDQRYGTERVGADPSDRTAEKEAVAHGKLVVRQQALSPPLRERVKELGLLVPAGRVFPSPKCFSDDPAAGVLQRVPETEWTAGMCARVAELQRIVPALLQREVDLGVVIANDRSWGFAACYARRGDARRELVLNVARIGEDWFDKEFLHADVIELVLHEIGHEFGDHLDHGYHEALCRLGGRLARMAADGQPGW